LNNLQNKIEQIEAKEETVYKNLEKLQQKEKALKEKELFLIQKGSDLNYNTDKKIRNIKELIEAERKLLKLKEEDVEERMRIKIYSDDIEELRSKLHNLVAKLPK
jgi:hypothetical protein